MGGGCDDDGDDDDDDDEKRESQRELYIVYNIIYIHSVLSIYLIIIYIYIYMPYHHYIIVASCCLQSHEDPLVSMCQDGFYHTKNKKKLINAQKERQGES
jgi:hypothetical protein